MIPWQQGKPLVWDATCVDTLAESYIVSTSTTPGSAADRAEERKRDKYSTLTQNYLFVPLGFETLGAWGPEAKSIISKIGKRIALKTGEPRSTEFLCQRIAIEIQRGNAISVMGTMPASEGLLGIHNLM